MNAKQTSTGGSQEEASYSELLSRKEHMGDNTKQISRNSGTSRKFLGYLGNECWKAQSREQCCESQLITTTFGVVIAGMTLVAATPPRPGQDPVYGRRRGPDEPCKQMAHFRNGQREYRRSSRKRRWVRRRGGETLCCTDPWKVGKSQQDQRDVPVPADKAANFIVVQSHIFGVFSRLLRYASERQWPGPSLARWFLSGQRRSSTLSRWDQSGCDE
jgi:hypothetical protein